MHNNARPARLVRETDSIQHSPSVGLSFSLLLIFVELFALFKNSILLVVNV